MENSLFEKIVHQIRIVRQLLTTLLHQLYFMILLAARSISHATGQHEIDCAFAGNVRKKRTVGGREGGGGVRVARK